MERCQKVCRLGGGRLKHDEWGNGGGHGAAAAHTALRGVQSHVTGTMHDGGRTRPGGTDPGVGDAAAGVNRALSTAAVATFWWQSYRIGAPR